MSTCQNSQKIKDVLTNMGAVHSEIELDEVDDGMAMKAELAGMGYTPPACFIGGEFIGDHTKVLALHAEKPCALSPMLIKAGSLSPTQRI